ncbi:hypothetical protein [Bacillus sp. 2205SS5-2]
MTTKIPNSFKTSIFYLLLVLDSVFELLEIPEELNVKLALIDKNQGLYT